MPDDCGMEDGRWKMDGSGISGQAVKKWKACSGNRESVTVRKREDVKSEEDARAEV